MAEILPGWTSELERSFKEVLFRFLEEVHSTKAALYLRVPDGGFQLATQYGFSRKEMIPVRHDPKSTLILLASEAQGRPIAVNDGGEEPKLTELLQRAGTTRMMVVPVFARGCLAGVVDVRDKGQKLPFEEVDLAAAETISTDLLRLVERTNLVAEVRPKRRRQPAHGAGVTARPQHNGDGCVLDEIGLEHLFRYLGEQTSRHKSLVAAALTVATKDRVGVRVLHADGAREEDRSPLLHHQAEALRALGWDPIPPDVWSVRSEIAPCRLEEHGSRVIGTRVALDYGGWALVVSVVGIAASNEVQRVVSRLVRRAREVSTDAQRRFARRQLSFKLLQRDGKALQELMVHSVAVSRLAWATAQELGAGLDVAEEAALAGLLHDVGMKELDYEHLYRHPAPGANERRVFENHPEVGATILRDNGLGGLASVVRHHHERWDGQGYPDHLVADAIPFLARVVHAAEVFDVLTSPESYRRPTSRERALTVIHGEMGGQFDPAVVTALANVVRRAATNDGEDLATIKE